MAVRDDRLREAGADALGDVQHLRVVGVAQQHRELVAAEARDRVLRAHAAPQAPGGRDEHAVADVVAERVVDDLEVVEVDQQHGETLLARRERGAEAFAERGAVGQLGQRVVGRAVAQALAVAARLRDVARVVDEAADARVVEQVRAPDVEPAPGAVGVLHARLEADRVPRAFAQLGEHRAHARRVVRVQRMDPVHEVLRCEAEGGRDRRAHVGDRAVQTRDSDDVGALLDERAEAPLVAADLLEQGVVLAQRGELADGGERRQRDGADDDQQRACRQAVRGDGHQQRVGRHDRGVRKQAVAAAAARAARCSQRWRRRAAGARPRGQRTARRSGMVSCTTPICGRGSSSGVSAPTRPPASSMPARSAQRAAVDAARRR